MHKRRKTTVTGEESSAEITKKLNDMSNTQDDDSDPDIVGVGEPKDVKRQGSQRTGKQTMSLKMS